jgi:hypothetical protein
VAWAIARDHAVQLDGEFYDLHAPVGVPIVDRGRLRQVRWEPRLLRHRQPHIVQPRRGHAARPAGETYSGPTRPAAEMVGSVVAELQGEPAADHRAESKRYESDERVKIEKSAAPARAMIVILASASSE